MQKVDVFLSLRNINMFFTSLLIAVMMYLVILGGSKNKSNEEIQREDEEQINYLKNYKNKK